MSNGRPRLPLAPVLIEWLTAKIRDPVLATIGTDGMPSLSVMWAIIEPDGSVLMNTAKGRRKYLDVLRDPRVSVCFEDGYEYVTLEGTVTLRDDPDFHDIERLRDRYGDDSDFRTQGATRVSLLMTVRRVLTHLDRLRGAPSRGFPEPHGAILECSLVRTLRVAVVSSSRAAPAPHPATLRTRSRRDRSGRPLDAPRT